jgi:hypothetical protein
MGAPVDSMDAIDCIEPRARSRQGETTMKHSSTLVRISLAMGLMGLGALGACERSDRDDRSGTYATPSSTPYTPYETRGTEVQTRSETARGGGPAAAVSDAAQISIASTRCEREMRCNNIGQGKRWATHSACVADIRASQADELNAQECPGGINAKELTECLQEIRNNDCNNPLDNLGRIMACRSSDLCLN